jgi:menaquinone-dependent protoporphyrinogen oxidase
VHPRGLQVFFGAWDPNAPKVGLTEQLVRRLPATAETPAGDFRDWPAIDVWSAEIARELLAHDVETATGG